MLKIETPMKTPSFGSNIGMAETSSLWSCCYILFLYVSRLYPKYEQSLQGWRINVWLSYPQLDPLGPVGELVIDEATGGVRDHTAIAVMKERALSLFEQHRDEIEAPLL